MSYTRLPIEEFGKILLESQDLDPIYVALYKMRKDGDLGYAQMGRWLIAYWCFYHAGVASYISDHTGDEFWRLMIEASVNETETPIGGRWPRAKERRHFRGVAAIESVSDLIQKYEHNPSLMLVNCHDFSAGNAMKKIQTHVGFGPWIAWKVADMMETVCEMNMSFGGFNLSMYREPTEAAELLYNTINPPLVIGGVSIPLAGPSIVNYSVAHLLGVFDKYDAPPRYNRRVDIQEIETILCKWKSHMNGHYPLYNDLHEVREGTEPWVWASDTAQLFLDSFPHAPN